MTALVRGLVRNADGVAVSGASVVVVEGTGPVPDISPVSNDEGEFVLEGIPSGTYVLRAYGPSGEMGEARVVVRGATAVDAEIVVTPKRTGARD